MAFGGVGGKSQSDDKTLCHTALDRPRNVDFQLRVSEYYKLRPPYSSFFIGRLLPGAMYNLLLFINNGCISFSKISLETTR